jgi:cytochrome c oxidase subunit 1
LTKDHKRIAVLYLLSVTAFFILGGIFAGLIRLELLTPASDLVESGTYNNSPYAVSFEQVAKYR